MNGRRSDEEGGLSYVPAPGVAHILGNRVGARLGSHVAGIGDVNGDGREDVLLGAPSDICQGPSPSLCTEWDRLGRAHLLLGGEGFEGAASVADVQVADVVHPASQSNTGTRVAGAGDVDGDGVDDLLIGSELHEAFLFLGEEAPGAGPTYACPQGLCSVSLASPLTVLDGSVDVSLADARFYSAYAGDYLGFGLAAGDVDGDGIRDILLGAPRQRHQGSDASYGSGYLTAILGQP